MSSESVPIRIVVICGPTGTGKTAAAIQLAQAIGAVIVSADSMQVYRYMDIGTAKPTPAERAAVPHHLIDVVDPDVSFNAQHYIALADAVIEDLFRRKVPVLVVGGTGLYIRALRYGLFPAPQIDPLIRSVLRAEVSEKGPAELYARLREVDPQSAAALHPNDKQRILRALEVCLSTGRPFSSYLKDHGFRSERYAACMIGLYREREALYERIDRRVDDMLEKGFLHEVERLLQMGYPAGLASMQSLGYRHLADFIEGRMNWDETVRTLKRDTRRFAKRQMTWFQKEKNMIWIDANRTDAMMAVVKEFVR